MSLLDSLLGNPAILGEMVPLALRQAGAPPAVVALVEQLGPAVGPALTELLKRHAAGEPLSVLRAELPNPARVVAEVEGGGS